MSPSNRTTTAEFEEEFEAVLGVAEVEENADIETEEYFPVEYSISSYGADYPVDGLVKRISEGAIYIPRFQRGYVWNIYRASRFIESLLLGLPVPAIFLSREERSQRLLVIDGQQRLRTLEYFYAGVFEPTNSAFRLRQVQERFEGATYRTLRDEDRRRLDDSILHAIIVKQEKPLDDDPSSIYHIFERLNTGGVLLQPQEIRSCIFHGPLAELLAQLNGNPAWRALFGKISSRMRDQELILRFFALLYESSAYSKPMKEFLNAFMAENRLLNRGLTAIQLSDVFEQTCAAIRAGLGDRAFKRQRAVNAALCDAVMVGVARRLAAGPVRDPSLLRRKYEELLERPDFQEAIESGTTSEVSVQARLSLATDFFQQVP